jgi:hypothetical protein
LSEKPISPNIKADTMCAINTAVGVSDISGDISESLFLSSISHPFDTEEALWGLSQVGTD